MNFRSLLTLPMLAVLVGCSEQKESDPVEELDRQWTTVSDNSQIALEGLDSSLRMARRCRASAEAWDCIYVHKINDGFIASRYRAAGRDEGHDVVEIMKGEGYRCEFHIDGMFSESIANSRGYLDTNLVPLSGFRGSDAPWTKEHVASFIETNRLKMDNPHFDCFMLARVLSETSIEAIGTSKITLSALLD